MNKKLTFEEALGYVKWVEGGYSNHKNDNGKATNLGVTQGTYNDFNRRHNIPIKNVRDITHEEARRIYKEDYWDNSLSSKIDDPKLALIYFDTAVNSGEGKAYQLYKDSKQDYKKYFELKQKNYDRIIKDDPNKKDFEDGWDNRLKKLDKFIEDREKAHSPKAFTRDEIKNMTSKEFTKNESAIMNQLKEKGDIPSGNILEKKNLSDYVNSNNSLNIFSREKLSKMSSEEFQKNEKAIDKQMKEIGIPTEKEVREAQSKSKDKSSRMSLDKLDTKQGGSSSGDGNWVTINGNHVLLD